MENIYAQRIDAIRSIMKSKGIDAMVITGSDPHNSEYVPARWEGRKWISGFDGSAGTAVVTMSSAALWTDSRYFIAAANQLSGTGLELMKERVAGTPTIAQWLSQQVETTSLTEVAIDGSCCSSAEVEALIADLRSNGGMTLRTNLDPLNQIWEDSCHAAMLTACSCVLSTTLRGSPICAAPMFIAHPCLWLICLSLPTKQRYI